MGATVLFGLITRRWVATHVASSLSLKARAATVGIPKIKLGVDRNPFQSLDTMNAAGRAAQVGCPLTGDSILNPIPDSQ